MPNYIELTFEIDSEPEPQQAQVKPVLTVEKLIENIAAEFEAGNVEDFELFRKGTVSPLSRHETLAFLGIDSGETLVFTRPILLNRRPIRAQQAASLEIDGTARKFNIQWQPAIIGRPDADPIHAGLLAVNLLRHPRGRKVSRRHAQITEENGVYYLESLAPNNPILLNKQLLVMGERYPLKDGDKIVLRNSSIGMKLHLTEVGPVGWPT